MYVKVNDVTLSCLGFIDEYSRYIVHWELLSGMDGHGESVAGQAALETLPCDADGQVRVKPEIRSDNGSCYCRIGFSDDIGIPYRYDPASNSHSNRVNCVGKRRINHPSFTTSTKQAFP